MSGFSSPSNFSVCTDYHLPSFDIQHLDHLLKGAGHQPLCYDPDVQNRWFFMFGFLGGGFVWLFWAGEGVLFFFFFKEPP